MRAALARGEQRCEAEKWSWGGDTDTLPVGMKGLKRGACARPALGFHSQKSEGRALKSLIGCCAAPVGGKGAGLTVGRPRGGGGERWVNE